MYVMMHAVAVHVISCNHVSLCACGPASPYIHMMSAILIRPLLQNVNPVKIKNFHQAIRKVSGELYIYIYLYITQTRAAEQLREDQSSLHNYIT
jgi:hypothetical protein